MLYGNLNTIYASYEYVSSCLEKFQKFLPFPFYVFFYSRQVNKYDFYPLILEGSTVTHFPYSLRTFPDTIVNCFCYLPPDYPIKQIVKIFINSCKMSHLLLFYKKEFPIPQMHLAL